MDCVSSALPGGAVTYLDHLVPPAAAPEDLFERLRALRLSDQGRTVQLGPLDQATLTLVRTALAQGVHNLYLSLPRGRHDMALLVGLYLQLTRLGADIHRAGDCPVPGGPLAVVGSRLNVTARLAQIAIGRQNLSGALRTHRIRGDGRVTDLRGRITDAIQWPQGLFYLNTALGLPRLGVRLGTVVVDRTSMGSHEVWERALSWADDHGAARVIAVAELGSKPDTEPGRHWDQWAWSPTLRDDVRYCLGRRPAAGPLTSNALLASRTQTVPGAAVYRAPRLASLRTAAMVGVIEARRVRAPGPWPQPVADAVRLLNLLLRSWGPVGAQDVWQVRMGRGRSASSLARRVDSDRLGRTDKAWALFEETHWPRLRATVLELYGLLLEDNPRLDMLLGLLAWADTARPGIPVTVRAASRAAATAVAECLQNAYGTGRGAPLTDVADDKDLGLRVLPYSERLPWTADARIEFHLGVPAGHRAGALLSAEATEHIVAVEQGEYSWLERSSQQVLLAYQDATAATATRLGIGTFPHMTAIPPPVHYGPVDLAGPAAESAFRHGEQESMGQMPSRLVDASVLFADFDDAVAAASRAKRTVCDRSRTLFDQRPSVTVPAVEVVTEPEGAVLWLRADVRVDILVGSRYATVEPVSLSPGALLLLPRGDARARLFDRLSRVVHDGAVVTAMDTLLGFFRESVRSLHQRFGTWPDVLEALQRLGCAVSSWQTVSKWADGSVIAPDDTQDIHRVALLARDTRLTSGRAWQRLGRIAAELRALHRGLGLTAAAAVAEAGRGEEGPALRRLRELCSGVEVSEIIEEFDLVTVRRAGAPHRVPITWIDRPPCGTADVRLGGASSPGLSTHQRQHTGRGKG